MKTELSHAKTAELLTHAACRVVIERVGATGVGITITQADGKTSHTFACRTDDAVRIGEALVASAAVDPAGERP